MKDTRPQDVLTPAPLDSDSGNHLNVPTGSPSKEPVWLKSLEADCADGEFFQCMLLTELYLDGQLIYQDPALAEAYLKQSCDMGFPAACQKLGVASPFPFPPVPTAQGSDLIDNYQAVVNESDCAVSGNPRACYLAGVAYLDGVGVPKDPARSERLLGQACKDGVTQACRERDCAANKADACFDAGNAYLEGKDTPANLNRAKLLLGRACDKGKAAACKSLANLPAMPAPGPAEQEVVAAGRMLNLTREQAQGCDKGVGVACRGLALLFERGVDLTQDLERALFYYDKACTSGDARACTRLGHIYAGEHGVEPDQARAEALYKRAAQLNQTGVDIGLPPSAAYDLADAYARGEGVPKDINKAVELFKLSCDFFMSGAGCRRVREIQNNTIELAGVEERVLPPSATSLLVFFARDCDGGGKGSCMTLGQFYARGHGVERDLKHAADLLRRACEAQLDAACTELAGLPDPSAAGAGLAGLCEGGDTSSCVAAGNHFAAPGAEMNLDKAAGFYETACMKQSTAGCLGLVTVGDRFRDGTNTAKDLPRAGELYRSACVLEHSEGCGRLVALGQSLEGSGGTANEDQAIRDYSEACRNGNGSGCGELWRVAMKYQNGSAADLVRARAIWKTTCESYSSIVGACGNLGVMYEKGQGGPEDKLAALQLYDRDCRRGSTWACTNYYYLEGTLNSERWVFNQPNVNQRVTEYKDHRFQPYDEVYVRAGGCVQTGGFGKTWKRYVDPSGANSDRLYHGTIWIPGATGPMQTLPGVIGRWLQIPKAPHDDTTNYFLRLGYEDDHYDDNGYPDNDFDEGTDHQCANTEDAWVVIYIRHHSKPLPTQEVTNLLPMDLWWAEIDDNLFPLNPVWGAQVGRTQTLPNAGTLCNYFNNDGDKLSLGTNCTTQRPTVDEPSILANKFNFLICHYLNGDQIDNLPGDSVHGHVNWWPVSYTGKIYFEDFQDPFLGSWQMPFGTGDDDYDWALVRDDEAGVLLGNKFQYHNAGKRGLTLEFDSREVIDNIDTPWWQSFHSSVDSHPAYHGDWTAAQSLVDGRDAIVIGLMGVDTKHTYHAELHPVFAMAIKVSEDGRRERWAIFARNWGDEGGCSQDQHYLPGDTVSLFFPNNGGQDLTIDNANTILRGYRVPVTWGAKNYLDGLVITFKLPAPEKQGMLYGEVEFCKGVCGGPPLLVSSPVASLLGGGSASTSQPSPATNPPQTQVTAEGPDLLDEGSLKPLLSKLTPEQQKKFAELLNVPATSSLSVVASTATNSALIHTASRDDVIAVARHRKLGPQEPRIPVHASSTLDAERAATFKRMYDALKSTVGGEAAADQLLQQLGP
ncbi:MAG TPA: tetratricopeptide repeat protein [Pyrinomonadaceae bacterium]|nr:tetratricopeptide repeat protein [Pyrinomonadaceae bacterium]